MTSFINRGYETAKSALFLPVALVFGINNNGFAFACMHGYLHVAKLILTLQPLVKTTGSVFINACINGHLRVVKWLINVNHHNIKDLALDYAFEWSWYFNKIKVMQILMSEYPFRYNIIKRKPRIEYKVNNTFTITTMLLLYAFTHKHYDNLPINLVLTICK
jgi:hypothetical protein